MTRRNIAAEYQRPRLVERVDDCDFYHAVELPGLGLQKGRWDLRHDVDAYLGGEALAGKHVLDVGTGSGFVCFEMEKRGAGVTAFDFDAALGERQHDLIPFHDFERRFGSSRGDFLKMLAAGLDRMKNSYWLSHRLLGSKARVFYGNVYDCDVDFGPVDVVFMGNILLHLASPVRALDTFAPYAREKVIITEACWQKLDYKSDAPLCYLQAGPDRHDFASWWQLTPGFLKQYLGVHGFTRFRVTFHKQRWVERGMDVKHFTLVASR